MNIVAQSVQLEYITPNALERIERAGRIAYRSEPKGDPGAFVRMLVRRKHWPVLEFAEAQFTIVTDRGVSHEIVRHRLCSFVQESTRYCNYGNLALEFVRPVDFDLDVLDLTVLEALDDHYTRCLERGLSPQQARYFLPNGLKTKITWKANMSEWRHIFSRRCDIAAHPQMRDIANTMLRMLKAELPDVFFDMEPVG